MKLRVSVSGHCRGVDNGAYSINLQASRLLVLAGVRRLELDGERHDEAFGVFVNWGYLEKSKWGE